MDKKNKKPKFPQKIYRCFILWETITDWFWVEPGSKEAVFFKPGWRAERMPNYNHPFRRRELKKLKQKQEEISKRKEIGKNWRGLT